MTVGAWESEVRRVCLLAGYMDREEEEGEEEEEEAPCTTTRTKERQVAAKQRSHARDMATGVRDTLECGDIMRVDSLHSTMRRPRQNAGIEAMTKRNTCWFVECASDDVSGGGGTVK